MPTATTRLAIRMLVLALVLGFAVSAFGAARPTIGVAQPRLALDRLRLARRRQAVRSELPPPALDRLERPEHDVSRRPARQPGVDASASDALDAGNRDRPWHPAPGRADCPDQ